MSDADALMWNIEKDPILRSTIVAVGILDREPDFDRLRRRLARASIAIPRLRQRVLSPPFRIGPPRWANEANFDLDFHLRRVRLAAPGDHRRLLELVAPIAQSSFDRAARCGSSRSSKGSPVGGPRSMKVHHSVTDGVGGIDLLSQIVDIERDADEPAALLEPPAPGTVRRARSCATRSTTRRGAGSGSRSASRDARPAARVARPRAPLRWPRARSTPPARSGACSRRRRPRCRRCS